MIESFKSDTWIKKSYEWRTLPCHTPSLAHHTKGNNISWMKGEKSQFGDAFMILALKQFLNELQTTPLRQLNLSSRKIKSQSPFDQLFSPFNIIIGWILLLMSFSRKLMARQMELVLLVSYVWLHLKEEKEHDYFYVQQTAYEARSQFPWESVLSDLLMGLALFLHLLI